jgi:hypothetical protein
MGTPAAILLGAIVIAAALAYSLRWEVVSSGDGVHRLDRWTGSVALCIPQRASATTIKYDCETK